MKNLINKINIFLFTVIVFFLTRQFPLNKYSYIMNISLIILVIFNIFSNFKNKSWKNNDLILLSLFLFLVFHFIYTFIFTDNLFLNQLRFFFIIFSLIFSFKINFLPYQAIKIFLFFILLQAITIIFLEFYLFLVADKSTVSVFRSLVNENEWGDIYSNGYFLHVQIKGNALLPFAFMLVSHKKYHNNFKNVFKLILITSIIFSGNFAFLIAILIFSIIDFFTSIPNQNILYKKVKYFFILFIILIIPLIKFISYKINTKFDSESIYERQDQTRILLNDLSTNPFNFFLGSGLGNTINYSSSSRDYRNSIFYEIQPLYFLNQMGFIFFSLYLILHVFYSRYILKDKTLFLIYFCYLIYSSTNPYIFDTNQFIVIIILITFQNFINKNELSRTNIKL